MVVFYIYFTYKNNPSSITHPLFFPVMLIIIICLTCSPIYSKRSDIGLDPSIHLFTTKLSSSRETNMWRLNGCHAFRLLTFMTLIQIKHRKLQFYIIFHLRHCIIFNAFMILVTCYTVHLYLQNSCLWYQFIHR